MKKKYTPPFLFFLVFLPTFFAYATTFKDFAAKIVEFINALSAFVSALALFLFIIGVVRFISTAGDDNSRKAGKEMMIWGTVALFVMISVWGLVTIIQTTFGLS